MCLSFSFEIHVYIHTAPSFEVVTLVILNKPTHRLIASTKNNILLRLGFVYGSGCGERNSFVVFFSQFINQFLLKQRIFQVNIKNRLL